MACGISPAARATGAGLRPVLIPDRLSRGSRTFEHAGSSPRTVDLIGRIDSALVGHLPCFGSHDTCLATRPDDQRAALETLRAEIRAERPQSVFRRYPPYPRLLLRPRWGKSKVLAGYAAMTAHRGVYVFEGDPVAPVHRSPRRLFHRQGHLPGIVRFTPDHPTPAALVAVTVATRHTGIGRSDEANGPGAPGGTAPHWTAARPGEIPARQVETNDAEATCPKRSPSSPVRRAGSGPR